MLVPVENDKDIPVDIKGIKVIPVSSVEELIRHVFPPAEVDELVS